MVELGIGKNMVRSLRFWVDVFGIAKPNRNRSLDLTAFAYDVFGPNGYDRFLEDQTTLWLLHWNLSSHLSHPVFAWHHLIGQWSFPEFTRTEALASFRRQSERLGHQHSEVTLAQHLDVFMHTYYSAKTGKVAIEDSIDGPLVDLQFLQVSGERQAENGRWEPVYTFRRDFKPEITPSLFAYCVADFWEKYSPDDKTLTFRAIMTAPGSPGQTFKLPEEQVHGLLEEISRSPNAVFSYQASAIQGLLTRKEKAFVSLSQVYKKDRLYA